jgi:hypothetical protein
VEAVDSSCWGGGGCCVSSVVGWDQIIVRTPPASPMITVGAGRRTPGDPPVVRDDCGWFAGGFISWCNRVKADVAVLADWGLKLTLPPPISSGRTPFIRHAAATGLLGDTQNVGGGIIQLPGLETTTLARCCWVGLGPCFSITACCPSPPPPSNTLLSPPSFFTCGPPARASPPSSSGAGSSRRGVISVCAESGEALCVISRESLGASTRKTNGRALFEVKCEITNLLTEEYLHMNSQQWYLKPLVQNFRKNVHLLVPLTFKRFKRFFTIYFKIYN